MGYSDEQTYIMVRQSEKWIVVELTLLAQQIKPDGVQRGLVSEIISRFEKRGYTLKGEQQQCATAGISRCLQH